MNRRELQDSLVLERYLPIDIAVEQWWTPEEQAQHRAALAAFIKETDVTNPLPMGDVDWDAVQRVCAGTWELLNPASRVEVYLFLHSHGFSDARIASRMRISTRQVRAIMTAIERANV